MSRERERENVFGGSPFGDHCGLKRGQIGAIRAALAIWPRPPRPALSSCWAPLGHSLCTSTPLVHRMKMHIVYLFHPCPCSPFAGNTHTYTDIAKKSSKKRVSALLCVLCAARATLVRADRPAIEASQGVMSFLCLRAHTQVIAAA